MAELSIKIDPRPAVDAAEKVRDGLDSVASSADRMEKALDGAGKSAGSMQRGQRVVQRTAADIENAFKGVNSAADRMGRSANDNIQGMQRHMIAAASAAGRLGVAFDVAKVSALSLASAATVAMRAFAPLMALAGGAAAISGVVRTSTEFESLGASLKTVTGSAANAERAFAYLRQFAVDTPYGLQQTTEAFIRLQALGLDPSRKALESYGNTASAMGKPIMQFVEAVADAVTGENERLKEFGVRASVNGEKVAYTFQGVTTTIGNNAKEIEEYLRRLGEVQFGGAMSEQMDTLKGAFANFGDAAEGFQNAIGEGGMSAAIKRVVGDMSDMLAANDGLARSIGAAIGGAINLYADAWDAASAALSEGWKWITATAEVLGAMLPSFQGLGEQVVSVGSGMASAAQTFAAAWNDAGRAILTALNVIIGAGVGAYQSVIATWDQLPAAFSALAKGAANMLISGLELGVNGALAAVNTVIDAINSVAPEFAQVPTVPGLDLSDYKQSLTEAESATSDTVGVIMAAATSTDYFGGALSKLAEPFAAVGAKIVEAKDRIDDAAASTQNMGDAAKLTGEGFRIATDGANSTGTATAEAGKKAEKATEAFQKQRYSVAEIAAELQRQIDMFDASEGATARLEFVTREMAKAWDIAREAGLKAIPAETLAAINAAAGQVEVLTDKLNAMRLTRTATTNRFRARVCKRVIAFFACRSPPWAAGCSGWSRRPIGARAPPRRRH
ncbi:tape measure protein [Aureimonas sp. ME7]|uniref:tape measure protein n=1 Tax=Aureimonas sp. ME7 TaxID=2744252 RepID=UPI0015F47347|nr:tape measure protein [Aureimonas sp. ME7]